MLLISKMDNVIGPKPQNLAENSDKLEAVSCQLIEDLGTFRKMGKEYAFVNCYQCFLVVTVPSVLPLGIISIRGIY